jgi:alginate O-acetyltransferase complex protein AlgI
LLFNSLTFALFFTCVLALHQLRAPWWFRKLQLVIASAAFYAAWNPAYVALWAGTTVIDWWVAQVLARANRPLWRRCLLGVSLTLNLGVLCTFKYADFLLQTSQAMLGAVGISWAPAELGLVLPVGISFYTFQTLSYTVDVYRGELKPTRSLLDFGLFVSFFPQLVAGPIVRARDFLPQCETPTNTSREGLAWGFVLLILGLFQKVILADTLLAPVADALFELRGTADTYGAWLGTLAFSGQIFCDFSGYSLCAVGAAGCLGFKLPDNFNAPYAAIGPSDFWRRWHISLSTWLRDYVYVSLGGNRRGGWLTLRNLMLTMLLGGLWHGAAWTFVLWGALHGAYLVLERFARAQVGSWRVWQTASARVGLGLLTFLLVSVSWIPFRAQDMAQTWRVLRSLWSNATGAKKVAIEPEQAALVGMVMVSLLLVHWLTRNRTLAEAVVRVPPPLRVLGLSLMLVLVLLVRGNDQAFIYFQF